MNVTLPRIEKLFKAIDASLFTIRPVFDYDRTIVAIAKLADMIHEYDGDDDDDSLWYIGEHGCATLDSLLVGAYWFLSDYHGGQSSPEYAAFCAIGQVFSPCMSSLDEDGESAEKMVYNALECLSPHSDRTEF